MTGPLNTFDEIVNLDQTTEQLPATATVEQDTVDHRIDSYANDLNRTPCWETEKQTLHGLVAARSAG